MRVGGGGASHVAQGLWMRSMIKGQFAGFFLEFKFCVKLVSRFKCHKIFLKKKKIIPRSCFRFPFKSLYFSSSCLYILVKLYKNNTWFWGPIWRRKKKYGQKFRVRSLIFEKSIVDWLLESYVSLISDLLVLCTFRIYFIVIPILKKKKL